MAAGRLCCLCCLCNNFARLWFPPTVRHRVSGGARAQPKTRASRAHKAMISPTPLVTPTHHNNVMALSTILEQLDTTADGAALDAALDSARSVLDMLQPESMGEAAALLLQWPPECDAPARRERWCDTRPTHPNPCPNFPSLGKALPLAPSPLTLGRRQPPRLLHGHHARLQPAERAACYLERDRSAAGWAAAGTGA